MRDLLEKYHNDEIKENMHILSDHFKDVTISKLFCEDVMTLLDDAYFRSEMVGFEDYPQRNNPDIPLIFASNHSGMAFPWDAMVLAYRIHKLCDYGPNAIRPITAPMLSASVLMNTYQINYFWKNVGSSIDASSLNFDTMMHQNDFNIMVYPEGVPGIGKGFDKRYQFQKVSTSMVRMSIKYQTDIIPFSTVNGEYINPYTYTLPFVNKIINFIGIPFLPVGFITFFVLLFPWVFYMGFPARLTYVMGKRIRPQDMTNKPFEELTYEDFTEIAEKIQAQMQAELTAGVEKYGQNPYQWGSFFKGIWRNIKMFPYTLPFGWPLLCKEFDRVRLKKKDYTSKLKLGFLSTLRILFQNPMTLAYFIPLFGWIPLGINGFRRVKNKKIIKTVYAKK